MHTNLCIFVSTVFIFLLNNSLIKCSATGKLQSCTLPSPDILPDQTKAGASDLYNKTNVSYAIFFFIFITLPNSEMFLSFTGRAADPPAKGRCRGLGSDLLQGIFCMLLPLFSLPLSCLFCCPAYYKSENSTTGHQTLLSY